MIRSTDRRVVTAKLVVAALGALLLLGLAAGSSTANDKVTICHVPPGNPANAHTITISEAALRAHLGDNEQGLHGGDYYGECDITSPSPSPTESPEPTVSPEPSPSEPTTTGSPSPSGTPHEEDGSDPTPAPLVPDTAAKYIGGTDNGGPSMLLAVGIFILALAAGAAVIERGQNG